MLVETQSLTKRYRDVTALADCSMTATACAELLICSRPSLVLCARLWITSRRDWVMFDMFMIDAVISSIAANIKTARSFESISSSIWSSTAKRRWIVEKY